MNLFPKWFNRQPLAAEPGIQESVLEVRQAVLDARSSQPRRDRAPYCRHRRIVGNQHGEICMDCNTRLFGMDVQAVLASPADGHQHLYQRAEAGYLICTIPGCDAYLKFGK